jgi:hypothetical protein
MRSLALHDKKSMAKSSLAPFTLKRFNGWNRSEREEVEEEEEEEAEEAEEDKEEDEVNDEVRDSRPAVDEG